MEEARTEIQADSWHLDKRVPIALIVALVGQMLVMVWQGARFYAEFEDHARRIVRLEVSDEVQTRMLAGIRETVIRIDERMSMALNKQDRHATLPNENQ